ncbi:MAG: Na+/H+ antiporter subunit E [Anaerolineales bacterium]|nr:Na+/H+ antiporter subunit E [Anaerolineales bacterium]
MLRFVLVTLALSLVYLGLTSNFESANIIIGLLLGAGVAALEYPRRGKITARQLPGAAWALLVYLARLAVDIIRSGLIVARIVLDPRLPIRPGIVAIRSGMGPWGTALSAHAITITPGEMVMEISEDGVMYTHCLDAESSGAAAEEEQAKRRALLEKIVT